LPKGPLETRIYVKTRIYVETQEATQHEHLCPNTIGHSIWAFMLKEPLDQAFTSKKNRPLNMSIYVKRTTQHEYLYPNTTIQHKH